MSNNLLTIVQKALTLGFTYATVIRREQILTDKIFREICAKNSCRCYGTNYMCPPLVGSVEECLERLNSFNSGVLVQSVVKLEDSFDYEGMMEGQKEFDIKIKQLALECEDNSLVLGAGPCKLCPECAAKRGEPCVIPKKAVSSLEAYCIDVNKTLVNVGLKYNNGENTVSYAGLIMLQ